MFAVIADHHSWLDGRAAPQVKSRLGLFVGSEPFLTCCRLGFHHWRALAGLASAYARETSVAFIGPVVASRASVALLKIQRTMDRTVVFTVSGRLDAENVSELCQLIDTEPARAVVVLDFTDVVLADRDAIRDLRDCETGDRIVLRNCPAYIRGWMAEKENH
jgi:hypothetical protein